MDPNKDNANPTTIDPSDLPTRSRDHIVKPRDDGGTGLFDGLISPRTYYSDASDDTSSGPDDADYEVDEDDEDAIEPIDEQEIYDLIATISDPEHPISLGSLAVVNLQDIHIQPPESPKSAISTVLVEVTPTISHCSLATVIGLGVRVRLEQALPPRFRIDVRIKEGTHSTGDAVSKQLGDKERVAAALENGTLMGVIRKMLATCE